MFRKMLMVALMTSLMASGVVAGTMKIYPIDDAYTTGGSQANTNFENFNLRVGNDQNHGKHRSYLKFDLSSLNGLSVTNAKLGIDPVIHIGTVTVEVHPLSSDSWNENTITWNNAPSHDSEVIDSRTISSNNGIEFDVFSLVGEPDNILSIALIDSQESVSNKYVQFFSSNNNEEMLRPYLEVTFGGEVPSSCNTEADDDCDGCVEINEVLDYISEWKNGNVNIGDVLNGITLWKTGEGCS
mgnify:CR=1 FL=1|tara:strand:- start:1056 stop:1778 length:723 start_codon:yes stop_codon:yes gene_type:complete